MPYNQHTVKKLMTANGGRNQQSHQHNSYEKLEACIVADKRAISIGLGGDFWFRRKGNLQDLGSNIREAPETKLRKDAGKNRVLHPGGRLDARGGNRVGKLRSPAQGTNDSEMPHDTGHIFPRVSSTEDRLPKSPAL